MINPNKEIIKLKFLNFLLLIAGYLFGLVFMSMPILATVTEHTFAKNGVEFLSLTLGICFSFGCFIIGLTKYIFHQNNNKYTNLINDQRFKQACDAYERQRFKQACDAYERLSLGSKALANKALDELIAKQEQK